LCLFESKNVANKWRTKIMTAAPALNHAKKSKAEDSKNKTI